MLTFPNDLEIAQAASIQHIKTIASRLGIDEDDWNIMANTRQNFRFR
jgi:formyltetrahydrofolate synthetase